MDHEAFDPSCELLLVEDNPGDVRLTQEALRELQVNYHLHVVQDGEQALHFLQRRGKYVDAPRPHLVLLDLNLPKKDGREVLTEVKRDPELRTIPIVVLTTSSAERDVMLAYDLHANCYITKPVDLDRFLDVVRQIERFWLGVATLPVRRSWQAAGGARVFQQPGSSR